MTIGSIIEGLSNMSIHDGNANLESLPDFVQKYGTNSFWFDDAGNIGGFTLGYMGGHYIAKKLNETKYRKYETTKEN